MKFRLVSSYFPPENGSASHLFYEIGSKLASWGHEVEVLTGFPSYHVDRNRLDPKYRKGLIFEEEMAGMRVLRVRTLCLPRGVHVLRGLDQFISAFIFFIRGLLAKGESPDATLVYSPPLPLGLAGWALSKLKGGLFILNVQDLFPQSAIDLGVLKNPWLIGGLRRLERFIYRRADLVTVHSVGNSRTIERCGIDPEKLHVVHNGVDMDRIQPGPRVNGFRRDFGIGAETFVVSFAGVIGHSQDLETVLGAARNLSDKPDILFLIVGDGVDKARLESQAGALGLSNVRFLPMQPKEKYPRLLHASDVCLVTLSKEVKTPVVPSKLLSIMAAGRAAVAAVPLEGDAPQIIRRAGCGLAVAPGEPQELADAILKCRQDRVLTEAYGASGRDYAVRYFSIEYCAREYERLITRIGDR